MPTWLAPLLPVLLTTLTPVLIGQFNKLVPRVPKVVLPLLAPVIGVLGSLLSDQLSMAGGAVAGAAGVALREIVDQAKKAVTVA